MLGFADAHPNLPGYRAYLTYKLDLIKTLATKAADPHYERGREVGWGECNEPQHGSDVLGFASAHPNLPGWCMKPGTQECLPGAKASNSAGWSPSACE